MKIKEYSICRVIVTLLVILGHSNYYSIITGYGSIDVDPVLVQHKIVLSTGVIFYLNRMIQFIYTFHMPFFIFLSGALFYVKKWEERVSEYKQFKRLIHKKFLRLMIPFFVVTFFYSVPLKMISGYYCHSHNVVQDVIRGQLLLWGNTHLWFLVALFGIFVIAFVIEKNIDSLCLKLGFVLCIYVLTKWIIAKCYIDYHYQIITNSMIYLFWFYLGYAFEQYRIKINRYIRQYKYAILFVIFIMLFVFRLNTHGYIILDNTNVGFFSNCLYGLIMGIMGILAIYWIALLLSDTKITLTRMYNRVLDTSFGLYLYSDSWNYFILYIVSILLHKTQALDRIVPLGVFVFRFIFTTVIAYVVTRILQRMKLKYIC